MPAGWRRWGAASAALLLIAASRLLRLNELPLNPDEIWSVWQTLGTPADILRWTPYDWPPGYYLTLGAWRSLTSLHSQSLRLLSVLAFMLGAAFVFRLLRRWRGPQAGVLGALAYAALGYGVLLSIEVRGYALLMALGPLALWLTERYFTRPTWRRGLALGVTLAAMLYVSLTSVGAVLALGLFTLIVYGRAVWRWWLPGAVAALLFLPEIVAKASIAVTRVQATRTLEPPPLPEALSTLFWMYAGPGAAVWAVITLVAALLLARGAARSRRAWALAVWCLLVPVALYALNPLLGFFSARYAWWVMLALALWAGWGLSYLPRAGALIASAALVALAFVPLPVERYVIFDNPSALGANFDWLGTRLQQGDVFLLDPSADCGGPEEWDYYTRLYFPNGLTFTTQPQNHQRVWHILFDGRQDAAAQQTFDTAFIYQGVFAGPARCLFRLYEAPPDPNGLLFDNGMRFHGAEVMQNGLPRGGPLVRHEGESIRLRLWWSVDQPPARDYSVGVYALRTGAGLQAESNSAPQVIYPPGAPVETSRWIPGSYYVEERDLELVYPTPRMSLDVYLAVYTWDDNARAAAPGMTDDLLLPLLSVYVMAY
jgi:hypothetical protein